MKDLKIYYQPELNLTLVAISSAITKFHDKYLKVSEEEKEYQANYARIFQINFRDCIIGEYFKLDVRK